MDLHEGTFMLLGPTLDPQTAFSISMRVPHLAIRMREHSRRAMYMAQQLHKLGVKVRNRMWFSGVCNVDGV